MGYGAKVGYVGYGQKVGLQVRGWAGLGLRLAPQDHHQKGTTGPSPAMHHSTGAAPPLNAAPKPLVGLHASQARSKSEETELRPHTPSGTP